MSKKRSLIVSLLVLIVFAAIVVSAFGQSGDEIVSPANTIATRTGEPEIKPSPTTEGDYKTSSTIEDFTGVRPSILKLNKVLGIPIETLEKMSASEITGLYTKNADILGVQVWETHINDKGEYTSELVAGSEIFDTLGEDRPDDTVPDPNMGYPAPTTLPKPTHQLK